MFLKNDESDSNILRHFMLTGFNSGEESILEFEQRYYGQMGIQVLAYRKDEKGYNQLVDVLREWSKKIGQVSNYLHTTFEDIDSLIKSGP